MVTLSAVRSAGAAEAARDEEVLLSRRAGTFSLEPVGVEVRLGVGGLVEVEAAVVVVALLLASESWARRLEGTVRWTRPGLRGLRYEAVGEGLAQLRLDDVELGEAIVSCLCRFNGRSVVEVGRRWFV